MTTEQNTIPKNEIKYHINPKKYFTYDNECKLWSLEIHLPGVEKSNIKFKVLPNFFDLEAIRDQAKYSVMNYFPWEVDVNSVEGKYENGLLYVTGKIKDPMEDSYIIKLE